MGAVWQFIQSQVLGMKWLNDIIGRLLEALGLDIGSRWGQVYNSFSMMSLKS